MISFLVELATDAFIFRLAWKGYQMTTKGQDKMYETEVDYKNRLRTGWFIVGVCILAVLANHFFGGIWPKGHSSD